ncbi:MAG: sodium:calcium antiporter [Deltaproteobacteria bacterium]|nr:MAG: sodium:calcium antiporter [Deltaproteobacteria bacterium]
MPLALAQLAAGLLLLAVAAERFVEATARLARMLGISAIVVGAVIIGVGTSLPEMTVTLLAAVEGEAAMGLGNAVGSNVANVTLVLGAAAVLSPLATDRRAIRREGLLALLACALATAACADRGVTRIEAAGLGLFGAASVAAMAWFARTMPDLPPGEVTVAQTSTDRASEAVRSRRALLVRDAVVSVLGLGAVLFGAHLLVAGAGTLARHLGASESVVGLTVVAVGTSLPELATSVTAARRGHGDLVLGNVLGSNLFNATFVAAAATANGTAPVDPILWRSTLAMLAAAIAAGAFAWTARRISRFEGIALLVAFAAHVYLTAT